MLRRRRRIVLRLGYLKMVDLLAEGHLIHQVMVRRQLLADFLPGDRVQQIKQANIEGQHS
jgi:hypothetical protein